MEFGCRFRVRRSWYPYRLPLAACLFTVTVTVAAATAAAIVSTANAIALLPYLAMYNTEQQQ